MKDKIIEEMAKVIRQILKERTDICYIPDLGKPIAEELYNEGCRKIPEGAVVLTREEHQKYLAFKIIEPQVRGCLDRERELEKQVRELDKELNLAKSVLSYDDKHPLKNWQNILRKETAEKFSERVKMAFYYEFDELIPSIMADKIDEIAKEITEN